MIEPTAPLTRKWYWITKNHSRLLLPTYLERAVYISVSTLKVRQVDHSHQSSSRFM